MPRSRTCTQLLATLLAVVAGLAGSQAHASACCMSTSVAGAGRLAVWEQAAAGATASYGHTTGVATADLAWRALPSGVREDEARLDAWGIVRLLPALEANVRAPWVLGVRSATDGATSVGTGVGDVTAGLRWDVLQLGEYLELPGVAMLLSVTAPTGRRPEEATDALGASATGRGAWAATLGVAVERAVVPWFVRLDGAVTLFAPFRRADTNAWQQFGPGLDVGLAGGRELLADRLVLALSLRVNHEWPLHAAGAALPDSAATSLGTALSASWKPSQRWTLTGAVSTDALGRVGLAQNRPERLAFTVGVRHGFY